MAISPQAGMRFPSCSVSPSATSMQQRALAFAPTNTAFSRAQHHVVEPSLLDGVIEGAALSLEVTDMVAGNSRTSCNPAAWPWNEAEYARRVRQSLCRPARTPRAL